jgi:hypothetical protein
MKEEGIGYLEILTAADFVAVVLLTDKWYLLFNDFFPTIGLIPHEQGRGL